jgi:hypothetical protein
MQIARALPKLGIMTRRTLSRGREEWTQGLAFWLLLLSIFANASVSAGAPLRGAPGSGFRASTAEAAIAPRRAPLPVKQAQLRARDEGGSVGPDADRDPIVGSASPSLPTRAAVDTALPSLRGSSRAGEGGAAFFSARAPPSA